MTFGAVTLSMLGPEVILVLTGLVVLLLDTFVRDKWWLPTLAGLGLVLAMAMTVGQVMTVPAPQFPVAGLIVYDDMSWVFRLILASATFLVVLGSAGYADDRLRGARGEYYSMLLFACASMMLLSSAVELITLYVALETSSIAQYALSGFLRDRRSSEAGIKYLLLGGVSSAVLLYGIAIFFGLTGTTSLFGVAQVLGQTGDANRLPILLAVVLMVAGFGFKLSTFPFQMWVPDVYEGAPTTVTAFLSVVSKAAGFAVVLRVFHLMLGAPQFASDWSVIFAGLSALGMTVGNLLALQQRNIKRMMAYSSIAQAGYLMIGLAVVPIQGPAGVTFFLMAYAASNLAAFIAIIGLTHALDSESIPDLSGAAQRSPFLAGCLAFAMLSLTGIPPTAGFFAKLTIFAVALQQNLLWLVLLGALNSVISAYYYIGVVKAMYLGAPLQPTRLHIPVPVTAAVGIASVITFLLGVLPDFTYGFLPQSPLQTAIRAAFWLQ